MAKSKDERTFSDHQRQLTQVLQKLPPLVVLEGEEGFLRATALNAVLAALRAAHPQAGESSFSGDSDSKFDFFRIIEALTANSLFASEKTVIIRNAQKEFFPQKMTVNGKSNPWQALADALNALPQGTFCIIEVEKINAARTLGKALNQGAVVPCPLLRGAAEVHSWLQAEAKKHGKTLERNAAELLQTCHGANLGVLAGEIEKLALFTADSDQITLEIVRQFMPDNEEFNSFALVNALEQKNLKSALHYARLIIAQGSRDANGKKITADAAAHILASFCASRFEQLLRARVALDSGENSSAVATRLRLPPWQGQKICEAARNFSLTELTRILETIADELHSAHDTGSDIALTLNKIVLAVCGKDC